MSQPVALVTGGASGIGLAVAEHLANYYGYKVALLDIDASRGRAAALDLNAGGDRCLFLHVDVSDYSQQAQAFQQVFEWGGNRLDVFFANAGIGDTGSVYKDLAGIDAATGLPRPADLKIVDVNLNAVLQGTHLARHFFAKNSSRRAGGHVIVTASCLGVYPLHALPLYSATKHALVGFVRSTAPVFKHALGIAINAILPNMVETNLMPEAFRPEWDPLKMTPMSTVLRAVDKILTDESVHGATIELCKDELVFSGPQAYATSNSKWVVEENVLLWERAMEVMLPRAAGQNVAMKQ